MSVQAARLPDDALLARYSGDPANYTDCYFAEMPGKIDLREFMTAFYTTPLFKAERWVLKLALRKPSTDADAAAVATGQVDHFAAWTVEDRTADEALLRDVSGGTRSWFKVAATSGGTRVYFGSAVTPGTGLIVRALTPLHRVYSKALLRAACRILARPSVLP